MMIREGEYLRVEVKLNGRAAMPVTISRRGDPDTVYFTDVLNLSKTVERDRVADAFPDTSLQKEARRLLQDVAVAIARTEPEQVGAPATPPAPSADQIAAWREEGKEILESTNVLSLVDEYLQRVDYAGDTRAPKLIYLGFTSRLLDRPLNLNVTGPSAAGKNFAVHAITPLFPPAAFYEAVGTSPLALFYMEEPFRNRMLVIGESSGLHEEGIGASLTRTLVWERHLAYDTVIDGEHRHLEKEGPTGLVTTSTKDLDPELSTRMWGVPIADDRLQTRKVLDAIGRKAQSVGGVISVPTAFVAAQQWLAAVPAPLIVVPYAAALAALIPDHEIRLRRDMTQLLTLICTHALLHQHHRSFDAGGRLHATLDDYRVVRDLVEPVFKAAVHSGITPELRDAWQAIKELTTNERTVTNSQLAKRLDISVPATWYRAKRLLAGGYLVNEETRSRQAAKLRIGEPLPEDVPVLPDVDQLEERIAIEEEGRQSQPSA